VPQDANVLFAEPDSTPEPPLDAPFEEEEPDIDYAAVLDDIQKGLEPPRDTVAWKLGFRRVSSIPYSKPKPPLVGEMLAAEGVTVIYGRGGTGKGMTSVYFAGELAKQGYSVALLDYENHPDEWRRRLDGMGLLEYDDRIWYASPYNGGWTSGTGKRGTLAQDAGLIRDACDQMSIDFVIVDSIVPASGSGADMGGFGDAQQFFDGIAHINRPALVIAHVPGNAQRFPDRPFGSTFIHNLARETWAIEPTEDPDPNFEWTKDNYALQPGLLNLQFRCKKRNVGTKPDDQYLQLAFYPDDSITANMYTPSKPSVKEIVRSILSRATEPLTIDSIHKKHAAESDDPTEKRHIRKMLEREISKHGKGGGNHVYYSMFERLETSPHTFRLRGGDTPR